MAKREIPEINAGSMADIAFLLLIFFLVTTTMDKDTAYERNIPKKIEIENQDTPPPIEERNICLIKANQRDQLMVRKELMDDPNEISDRIIEFYRMNEKLTQSEMAVAASTKSHPGFNFPLYSLISMDQVEAEVLRAEKEFEETEAMDDAAPAIIEYKENLYNEWVNKRDAMKLYGKPTLREIHVQAHIKIEVQKETSYELLARIHSEVREALYELRNDAAKQIFNESSGAIEKRYITNESDSQKKAETREDKAKLALLDVLYPSTVIEVTPK